MKLLAAILVILNTLKLILISNINESDIKRITSISSDYFTDLEQLGRKIMCFILLDGLVGLLCGVYLLFI